MMMKSLRWILVGSLVSILMMGGLGLAMGKKVEKEEATTKVEEKQIEVQQKQVEAEQKGKEKVKVAVTKDVKSEIIEPKLIWSKEFESGIEDVVISDVFTKGGEGIAGGAPAKTVFPIKVVVTKNAVRFLDEQGEIINEVPLEEYEAKVKGGWRAREWAFVSPDGEYLIKYKYGDECVEEANLYAKNGRFVSRVVAAGFDPIFSLNGDFFITTDMGGGITWFHDREGNLIKKIEEYAGIRKFSADGKYVVGGVGDDNLYLFDNRGNQLWRSNISGSINDIAVSKDNMIAAVASSISFKNIIVYLFNKKGDKIWEYSLPFMGGNVYVTLKGDYLAVGQGNYIYLLNTITKELVWKKEIEGAILERGYGEWGSSEDPIFISTSGEYLLIKGHGFVLLLDKKGRYIWKKEMDEIPKSATMCLEGKNVLIKTKRGLYVYQNPVWQVEGGAK